MIGCSESINNFPDQLLLSQFCTFLSPIGISCISYNTPSRDLAGIHAQGRNACIPAQIPTMGCYNLFIACGPGVIITDSPAVHISGPQCMYLIRALQHNTVGCSSLYKRCKRSKETPGARL